MSYWPQQTIMVIEETPKSTLIGIVDQNGNPIVKHELAEPIGFYVLREKDDDEENPI